MIRYAAATRAALADDDPYRQFMQGLRRIAAPVPPEQATPITWTQISCLMQTLPPRDAAMVFVMWKTASRWDEVSRLTPGSMVISRRAIDIHWGTHTKTSAEDPHQERFYTRVVPNAIDPTRNTQWEGVVHLLSELKRVAPEHPVATMSQSAFLRQLKLLDRALSLHSVKVGALREAATHAASGAFPPRLLSVLAKHQHPNPQLAPTTVQYLQHTALVASLNGTAEVTRYL
jgi:hypothetical protein